MSSSSLMNDFFSLKVNDMAYQRCDQFPAAGLRERYRSAFRMQHPFFSVLLAQGGGLAIFRVGRAIVGKRFLDRPGLFSRGPHKTDLEGLITRIGDARKGF